VDFGIVLFTSDRGIPPADAAAAAERNGFTTFYVPEHSHIPTKREVAHPATGDASLPDDRYMRTLDPWVSLSAACAVTNKIRLSTAVCLPAQHDCITLAKAIATLDHLSGGRVQVCAGFGWNLDELADHNVPAGRRRTMLREYIEAMRELWTKEEASYSGEFVNYGASWAWPKTVQGRVPVLIGATGNEKNFKWIAKNADGWMSTPQDADIERLINSLYAEWDSAGRTGSPRIVVLDTQKPDASRLSRWADLGVSEVVYGMPDKSTEEVRVYLGRLVDKLDAFGALSAGTVTV
jgi:probable F420-dependent oxidoreductase